MTEDVRQALIEDAMFTGMTSMSGIAIVHRPPSLRKETTRTINNTLHQWKQYTDPHAQSTLGLRRSYGDADSSPSAPEEETEEQREEEKAFRSERVAFLLQNLNYLRKKQEPTFPLFSAHFFHSLIIDHLYIRTPTAGRLIDHTAPHVALDNLFAFGAAAIAASLRDYQEGVRSRREVTSAMWRADYHQVREQIRQIRGDEGESLRLDRLQRWMLARGRVEHNRSV